MRRKKEAEGVKRKGRSRKVSGRCQRTGGSRASALVLEVMGHSLSIPPGPPDPGPVTRVCAQLLSRLFCGRVFVWFGVVASVFFFPHI